MKFKFAYLGLVVGLSVCASAMAEDPTPKLDLTKQTAATFQVQEDHVMQDMQKGGRFEYISDDDRKLVEGGLTFMHDLIEKNGSVAAMNDDDRLRLFNRQERVNTLLTKNDSLRIVCAKALQTGTMFKSTTCHTVAELERLKRDSVDTLERTHLNQTAHFGNGASGLSAH
ncbi:MAG TPA: hypothetical protein VH082_00335 [Rudaea sp.]|jgi:hypothetical protein|nr:hypothetical protein [Rudaea sp.]